MSTSSEPTETTTQASSTVSPVSQLIHERVVSLADRANDRTDFFQRLAAELLAHFSCGLVAVESPDWTGPMMLVTDNRLAAQISRPDVQRLLAAAGAMPVASNIALDDATSVDSPTHEDQTTQKVPSDSEAQVRGLQIELTSQPERAALLLVYPLDAKLPAITQIANLRELQSYGESTRQVIARFQSTIKETPSKTDVTADAEPQALVPIASRALSHHRSLRYLHRDLDLDATCFRIANESRRLLGCDRTTVLIPRGRRFQVAAVSGVAVVDKRGNSVSMVQRLVNAAVVMSRPLVFPSDDLLPAQIAQPLDDYFDETGVTSAIILPLHSPDVRSHRGIESEGIDAEEFDPFGGNGDCIGVLMLEYFSGDAPRQVTLPMTVVSADATLALRNSLEHRKVFGLRLWKWVGSVIGNGRLPWVAASLICLTMMMVAATVINVEHYVVATGTAEPTMRRDVFATIDGVVKTLHVTDGQTVKAGETLLELENAELESRAEALAGEIQTATQRLLSIQAIRLSSESDPSQSAQLAIELRQVESELASLKGQQDILQAQRNELIITSPIDGMVVGWQLERRLADRPVTRGNALVSVVDPSGPWSLRLQIPDRDAGGVIEAAKVNAKLPIEFAIATRPESSFAATLNHIATAARMDSAGQYVIDADATIDQEVAQTLNLDAFETDTMRSGADVTAKLACGERTILRSWFGDVFDFVHRNILFYF